MAICSFVMAHIKNYVTFIKQLAYSGGQPNNYYLCGMFFSLLDFCECRVNLESLVQGAFLAKWASLVRMEPQGILEIGVARETWA